MSASHAENLYTFLLAMDAQYLFCIIVIYLVPPFIHNPINL